MKWGTSIIILTIYILPLCYQYFPGFCDVNSYPSESPRIPLSLHSYFLGLFLTNFLNILYNKSVICKLNEWQNDWFGGLGLVSRQYQASQSAYQRVEGGGWRSGVAATSGSGGMNGGQGWPLTGQLCPLIRLPCHLLQSEARLQHSSLLLVERA